jgi:phospholipase C
VRQDGQLGNIKDVSEFTKAAKAGTLPAVSWVIPDRAHSDHPSAHITVGQSYVTGLINAVMSGPNWNDTVILLAWDD